MRDLLSDFFRFIGFGVASITFFGLCYRLSPLIVPIGVIGLAIALGLVLRDLSQWISWLSFLITTAAIGSHRWISGILLGLFLAITFYYKELWDRRIKPQKYQTTVYLSKRRAVQYVVSVASTLKLQLTAYDCVHNDGYVLTLSYNASPILNHIFLRTLIAAKSVRRLSRQDIAVAR